MDNNWTLLVNSPYLLVPNPFYNPLQPPSPPPAPPQVPNFPDLFDDFDNVGLPQAPDIFYGLWNDAFTENNLIRLLVRWLGNEPLNVDWMNIRNFYQYAPSTLAGISAQVEPSTYYFITPVVRHNQNRANRTVGEGGAWRRSEGRVRQLMNRGVRIGTRRSFYYEPPSAVANATRWLMKEFTIYPPIEINNFAVVKLHRPQ